MWQTPGIATGSHQGRKENLADDQMGAFTPWKRSIDLHTVL